MEPVITGNSRRPERVAQHEDGGQRQTGLIGADHAHPSGGEQHEPDGHLSFAGFECRPQNHANRPEGQRVGDTGKPTRGAE
jgi:hypothetical protein